MPLACSLQVSRIGTALAFHSGSVGSGTSFAHLVDLPASPSQLCLGCCWRLGLEYPHLLQGHPSRGPAHAKAQKSIVSRARLVLQLQLGRKE